MTTTTPEDRWAARPSGRTTRCSARTTATSVTYTCRAQQGVEAEVLARQRDSVAKSGERYVDDVTAITIDGDRATATVTYHFDKTPEHQGRPPS